MRPRILARIVFSLAAVVSSAQQYSAPMAPQSTMALSTGLFELCRATTDL